MNIMINKDLKITSDQLNIIIQTRHISKPSDKHPEGVERWEIVSYHPNLSAACTEILRRVVHMSEADSVLWLRDELRDMEKRIIAAVKGGEGNESVRHFGKMEQMSKFGRGLKIVENPQNIS